MADSVQQRLDQMVPALVELQERGIFSPEEIRVVVAKRREFEYKLRRLVARKPDYLRYLAYEINLEALRKIRRKKAKASGKLPAKRANHEFAGIKHIRSIFERATRRFLADEELWLQYVEWALDSGSIKLASQAVSRALQFHPHSTRLWAKAASFEFFRNGNAQAARVLLQRGLRMNRRSSDLWVEYFRLEWLFIDKKRAKASGKNSRLKGLEIDQLDGEEDGAEGPPKEEEEDMREFYQGAVPLAVYRSCIAALPKDLELRWRFAEVAAEFETSGRVLDAIRHSIVQDFRENPEGWEVLSRFPFLNTDKDSPEQTLSAIQDATQIFEEGINKVPKSCGLIWEKYTKFLMNTSDNADSKILLDIYARAVSNGALTLPMGRDWIMILEKTGNLQEALQIAQKLCSLFKENPEVWLMSAKLHEKSQLFPEGVESSDNQKSPMCILREGIGTCNKESNGYPELWHMLLATLLASNASQKKIAKTFRQALAACPNQVVEFGMNYLQWAGLAKGTVGVRSAFADLESAYLTSDPSMLPIYDFAIRVELGQNDGDLNLKGVRLLYEKTVDRFGMFCGEIWEMYENFERSLGHQQKANSIKWRAQRACDRRTDEQKI